MIINPGSRITNKAVGWTNTHGRAFQYADEWLDRMASEGFDDLTMVDTGIHEGGRWTFSFQHTVTGKIVLLQTHGIDNLDAYRKQCVFEPRVYWNGSSSAEPRIEDFAAPGFSPVITYRKDRDG